VPPEELLHIGSAGGAAALGLAEWPQTQVDRSHPSLAGVADDELEAALLFGCGADVFSL
jgi:hypothetical protein